MTRAPEARAPYRPQVRPGRTETTGTARERTMEAVRNMVCVHDGRPCAHSRRCLYNVAGSKSARMNMCVLASAGQMATCRSCADKDRCAKSWQCFRRECTA